MKLIYTNIIAGLYKNRKILLPSLDTTRASKKILRESFFNTISFEIQDEIFIETFAGSGSMGIEALSRGAKKSVFFEQDKKAFEILQSNLQNLKIDNGVCIFGDSFVNVQKYNKDLLELKQKAYFYFDPPFSYRDDEDIYNKTIDLIESIDKQIVIMICIEHMSSISFDESIGDFTKIKEKKFGKSMLSYFEVS